MRFKKFEIKNLSRSRRGGFSHDSTLYFDGVQINKKSVHYYNRTWESYPYQTSMRRVVEDMIDFHINQVHRVVFPDWKRLNDTRRKKLRECFKSKIYGREVGGYTGTDLLNLLNKIDGYDPEPDPVLNSMKGFLMLGDLMSINIDKERDTADAVKYKEKIVFATMRNKIPGWQKPKDWDRLNDADKLERLTKIQNL